MSDDCVAGAILLGGSARRFGGVDKSALLVDGVPILTRLVETLRPVTSTVFAVGDRYGAAAAAGLPIVEDDLPDGGPLGAIYTAIVRSPCERTVVVACDMPYLTPQFVSHLVSLSSHHSEVRAVMPRSARGYEPLCAVYVRNNAASIRQRLDAGERRTAAPPDGAPFVEVGPEEIVTFDPHGLLFVNVNTAHDYERALRPRPGR
jgi:molybdopterin-guanine dinucleotide biosynthesis protein A